MESENLQRRLGGEACLETPLGGMGEGTNLCIGVVCWLESQVMNAHFVEEGAHETFRQQGEHFENGGEWGCSHQ